MKDLLYRMHRKFSDGSLFDLVLFLGVITITIVLALYAYLGTFSRYGSDDYCLSAFYLQGNLINAMIQRYFISTSRYTNIIFIGLADKLFGWYNVAILPALMLSLFVGGMYLLLKEIIEMLRLGWSRWMALFTSLLIV